MIASRVMDDRCRQAVLRAFGERLREIRKGKGLSQERLSLLCGLDQTYLSGIERGRRNVSLVNIHRIARALGLSSRDLLD